MRKKWQREGRERYEDILVRLHRSKLYSILVVLLTASRTRLAEGFFEIMPAEAADLEEEWEEWEAGVT